MIKILAIILYVVIGFGLLALCVGFISSLVKWVLGKEDPCTGKFPRDIRKIF